MYDFTKNVMLTAGSLKMFSCYSCATDYCNRAQNQDRVTIPETSTSVTEKTEKDVSIPDNVSSFSPGTSRMPSTASKETFLSFSKFQTIWGLTNQFEKMVTFKIKI